MIKKCEEEPKLCYRNITGKMTSRETINKIVKEGRIYQTVEEMSEIMNESLRSVFNVEVDFTEPNEEVRQGVLWEVLVQKHEIGKLLKKLDVRKAMGPV